MLRKDYVSKIEFGFFVSPNSQCMKITENGKYEIELSLGMLGAKAEKYTISLDLDMNKTEKTEIISNLHTKKIN